MAATMGMNGDLPPTLFPDFNVMSEAVEGYSGDTPF